MVASSRSTWPVSAGLVEWVVFLVHNHGSYLGILWAGGGHCKDFVPNQPWPMVTRFRLSAPEKASPHSVRE